MLCYHLIHGVHIVRAYEALRQLQVDCDIAALLFDVPLVLADISRVPVPIYLRERFAANLNVLQLQHTIIVSQKDDDKLINNLVYVLCIINDPGRLRFHDLLHELHLLNQQWRDAIHLHILPEAHGDVYTVSEQHLNGVEAVNLAVDDIDIPDTLGED